MSSLDPRIEKELREAHDRQVSQGKMLSRDRRKASLEAFQSRFGPHRLRSLDGPELLRVMHTHGNRDSLVYWVEYKNDDEFAGLHFGGISGGGAHMYGIFRRKDTDQWVKGSPRSEENITEAEAVVIARNHRDQLLAGAELLEQLPLGATDDEYVGLQKELEKKAPDLATKAWAHKYWFLNFPDKLDDFHNERWQRHYVIKMLQEPPEVKGLYVCGGRYLRLAAELGWPVNELTNALMARSGRLSKYWRVGTRIGGKDSIWEDMKAGSYIAVGWDRHGDLSAFTDHRDWKTKKAELTQIEESLYPTEPKHVASRQAGELLNFVAGISEDELVIAGDGEKVLGIAKVIGPYYYDATEPKRAPHRRSVEWLSFDQWKQFVDGPRTTVWELRKSQNMLEIEKRILGAAPIPQSSSISVASQGAKKLRLSGIPGRIQSILDRKGQAILYGPPGTGKTYWARQTAFDLAAIESFGRCFNDLSPDEKATIEGNNVNSGLVRCCTFHPAYGYEDFLEGYRPEANVNGQLVFQRHDGIFKRICTDARQAPHQKFFLLVDEINRGDIPRIFGELLTLLELDKRGVALNLPLSGDRFDVPKNVCVIGTMNTADRSIALLDTALRRRFGFLEMMPDMAVFAGAVVDGGVPLGPWLEALNDRIREHMGRDGRNLQVGHAYLLKDGKPVIDFPKFVQILDEDLIPLLEEYCYEDYSALSRILGDQLVDEQRQCIREELFKPARREDLVQALLAPSPDIVTSIEASASTESTEEIEDDPEAGDSEA